MRIAPTPLAFSGRIYILIILMFVCLAATLLGYFRVQVMNRERYEALGEKYRVKNMPIKATRGYIYDRMGNLLVQNMPTYNLTLQRDEMEEPWRVLKPKLSGYLGIPEEELQHRYLGGSILLSKPVLLKENLDYEETLRVKRQMRNYPGIGIETTRKRTYPSNGLFAHVLGYVGEASAEEMSRNPGLKLGEIVGKNGMELAYNSLLTGSDGVRAVHIDNRGVYRSQKVASPPEPGNDLYLTLDYELQSLAYQAMEGRGGSVVMMNARTGEILVYLSSPTFDLNLFSEGFSQKTWDDLTNAGASPFLNRPVKGAYAPGSVFKMVTALAALKNNKITPTTQFFCNGGFTYRGRTQLCHKKGGHGTVSLIQAIQYSCNVYFFNVATELSIDQLSEVAFDLGLGKPTGVDLIGEHPGLMPNRAWKRQTFNESWYPGETLSVAIGQGALLATPLQLCTLMATISTKGTMPQPHLLLKYGTKGLYENKAVKTRQVQGLEGDDFELIKEAMWRVVNEDRGTGDNARIPGLDVCGKTGTAQLINFKKDDKQENQYLNAWFAGFAPRENPEVAIIVLVEQAGHGGSMAAPIAKLLIERYHERTRAGVPPS